MSRQRIEDLGRLEVLLSQTLECELLENISTDVEGFVTCILAGSEATESCLERLSDLYHRIKIIETLIFDMREIARGQDTLNDNGIENELKVGCFDEMMKFTQGFAYQPKDRVKQ